jgi:exoribonuclease R
MKTLVDPARTLSRGLTDIRERFQIPERFPAEVLAAADRAAERAPTAHVDRTAWPFVTLDPATSTDLDQAFTIARRGEDLLLHYAIADIGWFVEEGGAIDTEAWRRGSTLYLPDGKAGLYPPVLSEGAASLLPSGPRPAVLLTVKVTPDGKARLEGVERALIRSQAKLAYDSVQPGDLPPEFEQFSRRIKAAEARRGASRVDPPEQEVVDPGDGRLQLQFRPRVPAEDRNATLSLAANLAVADCLLAHRTGLFRVMAEPDPRAVVRLRRSASVLGLRWPPMATLAQYERTLDPADPAQAAFMLAVRRAGAPATYAPYDPDATPWQAAIAAPYAHATAPLRRLADRYVLMAALAIAKGLPVPEAAAAAFPRLPTVMAHAASQEGQIERAVIDLAEAILLSGREGETLGAVVIDVDERGARIQLCDLPIVARVAAAGATPGEALSVRVLTANPEHPPATFALAP